MYQIIGELELNEKVGNIFENQESGELQREKVGIRISKWLVKHHITSQIWNKLLLFKDTHREKHPKIKLQRSRIWTFGSLVHQINTF